MTSRTTPAGRSHLYAVPPNGPPQPRLPSPTFDDSQLLAAVRAGDPDAATAVHDRLRPIVERSVRRLLGPRDHDHEDLAQQAMIEVVYTIDKFRGDCPLDAWASTVAAHVVYNQIRRRTTERKIFDSSWLLDQDGAPASTRSLARDTAARSTLRRVFAHLEAMDQAKAWAYLLHDVCGYDLKEVSQITEASVAAAQTRLVRGRRELHERMAADPELASMMGAPSNREDA